MSLFRRGHSQKHTSDNKISLILASAIIAVLLSGCYFFPKEEEVLAPPIKEPDKVTYETIEVKKGTIEKKIRCTGTFVSVSQKDLFYKDRGGRLKAIHVVPGDKVKKGDLIAEIETDTILNDIQLQEITLKKAQIIYDNAKARLDIEGGSKTDFEMAELDLEANLIKLNSLKTELERTKLFSPIDGEVVYLTDIKLGEYINAHQTVARVADPTQIQLRYSDDKVSDFSLGMKADVQIDEKKYTGEVVITPYDMPSDADEATKKSVQLKVENMPEGITIGSTATINLTLEKREDVIVLPKQVVNNFVGRKYVNVLKNNIREERDIELGIQSDTEVEVVKGLDVGELIIIR